MIEAFLYLWEKYPMAAGLAAFIFAMWVVMVVFLGFILRGAIADLSNEDWKH